MDMTIFDAVLLGMLLATAGWSITSFCREDKNRRGWRNP